MAGRSHALLDRLATASGLVLRDRSRYFAGSLESASLADHLAATTVDPPILSGVGHHELPARTRVGDLDPACWVQRWIDPTAPTLIVHHGNNERPFELGRTAKNELAKALLRADPPEANVILLRAAYHAGTTRQYLAAVGSLDRFAAMLAASAVTAEAVITAARQGGSPHVVMTGFSLGGWVVNLHRAYLGTADRYLPICAGAALDELFVSSAYRRLASKRARQDPERLRDVLNFEEAFGDASAPVTALLARYDQYVELATQRAAYRPEDVRVIDKGHLTTALDVPALRDHVLPHLTWPSGTDPDGATASA